MVILLISATILPGVTGRIDNVYNANKKKTSSIGNLGNKLDSNQILRNALGKIAKLKAQTGGLFTSVIHTNCDGVEKSTEINFAFYNDIDVDNNSSTGINGADIRIQYLVLPWIEFEPDLAIGLIFTISVERIGNEIKNSDFRIWMEIGQREIEIGYCSPKEAENEIPNFTRVAFILLFGLYEPTFGFTFALIPEYNSGNTGKKIELFSEYNIGDTQRSFSFEFDPAIETQIRTRSTRSEGKWQYEFNRDSSMESKVTSRFKNNEKETTLIFNKLPKELTFSLGLTPLTQGGGQFLYESDQMYDIELIVTSNQQGSCRYATIRNTPKRLFAEWTPTLTNGTYSLEIDSDGTDFILQDSLTNPLTTLTINDLKTINIYATWNLSNPGDFTVKKKIDLNVDLDFIIGEWNAKLIAEPTSDIILTTWLIGSTGYLSINTDWNSLNEIDLLIKAENLGLRTVGETFKTEFFKLSWNLWPITDFYIIRTGKLDFSSVDIDVYINNVWYNLWPWPP